MPSAPETPHRDVTTLITGHFRQKSGYLAWRPRGTRDWLMIYTLAGRGRFGFGGNEIIVERGDAVLIAPGTPHDYGVEPWLQRWELLWSHFVPRAHWLEWLHWPSISRGLMKLNIPRPQRPRLVRSFRKAHELASRSIRHRQTFAMNTLEEMLLICDECNPRSMQSSFDSRVRDAMDFIYARLADSVTLGDIAEASGLSVSRLSTLVKAHLGVSPMQYLEAQRVDRAKSLLTLTNLSVKEIAQRVGFSSPFYFSHRFKAATGKSPRAFRGDVL